MAIFLGNAAQCLNAQYFTLGFFQASAPLRIAFIFSPRFFFSLLLTDFSRSLQNFTTVEFQKLIQFLLPVRRKTCLRINA